MKEKHALEKDNEEKMLLSHITWTFKILDDSEMYNNVEIVCPKNLLEM